MKKNAYRGLWTALLFPLIAALVLTLLSELFGRMYYDWYWVKEWFVYLPGTVAYYLILFTVFSTGGVAAYLIFFGEKRRAVIWSAIYGGCAFLAPLLRFLARALALLGAADASYMLSAFLDDLTIALGNLLYFAVLLLVLWLEKFFYRSVLKEKPENQPRVFSLRHPAGLAFFIFSAALFCISLVTFLTGGDFSGTSFLMLGLEAVIDVAGFFIGCGMAALAGRWSRSEAVSAGTN